MKIKPVLNIAAAGFALWIIYSDVFTPGEVSSSIPATVIATPRLSSSESNLAVVELRSGGTLDVECSMYRIGDAVTLELHQSKVFKRKSYRCKLPISDFR